MNKELFRHLGWVFWSGSVSGLAACMKVLRTGEADGLKNRLEDRAR